jgi:hypothetical protein
MTSRNEETIISVIFADDTAYLSVSLSDFLYHEKASIDTQSLLLKPVVRRQLWRHIPNYN